MDVGCGLVFGLSDKAQGITPLMKTTTRYRHVSLELLPVQSNKVEGVYNSILLITTGGCEDQNPLLAFFTSSGRVPNPLRDGDEMGDDETFWLKAGDRIRSVRIRYNPEGNRPAPSIADEGKQTTSSAMQTGSPESADGSVNSSESMTSVGVGDVISDFKIEGKSFDFGISDVFRMRICEADLYDHPLSSSRGKFYEFLVVRYRARSSLGQGRSFINASELILSVNGSKALPYVEKHSTRLVDGDRMPPVSCRKPVYCERVSSLVNGSRNPGTVLYTNEGSFSYLNVGYLTDGVEWTSSDGVSDYLSGFYKIPTDVPLYAESDNGKSVTIGSASEARWVTPDEPQVR
jgi:hypothetical protein